MASNLVVSQLNLPFMQAHDPAQIYFSAEDTVSGNGIFTQNPFKLLQIRPISSLLPEWTHLCINGCTLDIVVCSYLFLQFIFAILFGEARNAMLLFGYMHLSLVLLWDEERIESSEPLTSLTHCDPKYEDIFKCYNN